MSIVRLAPEQHDTIDGIPEPAEARRLVGHAEAVAHVAAAFRAGRLHHALLLVGPSGIGKASFAFQLAHHVLAHPDAASAPPAFETIDQGSALYRQVAQGAHPAVLHLTRPFNDKSKSFRSAVTVDEIRRIGRFLSMTAHDGAYRIVIVDPADDMNANAANALLKNLEEPPARTLFVLIAHSSGSLLPTIRSRCQVIKFSPLQPAELRTVLEGFDINLPGDVGALADKAGGSVREALLLLEYGGLEIAQAVERMADTAGFDAGAAIRIADAVSARDAAVAFSLFNRTVLDVLADRARAAALAGDGSAADRLARTWSDAEQRIGEVETFNLDKKAHAIGLLRMLSDGVAG